MVQSVQYAYLSEAFRGGRLRRASHRSCVDLSCVLWYSELREGSRLRSNSSYPSFLLLYFIYIYV